MEALVKQNSKNLADLREMHVADTKALQEKVESQDQQLVAWGKVIPLREELSSLKELLEFKNSKIHTLQQDAKAKEKFLEDEKSSLRLKYNNLKKDVQDKTRFQEQLDELKDICRSQADRIQVREAQLNQR
ncbi:uncharacterized protein RAG0_00106 [Rhynchosporium agropyri]|uniref:Uncharacterized protein n=1 Tax=Rhynchosporium agropyri TaxID=914238 RepID=A0A1E1JR98_9HELO|nr:uncharacterized protein RAG0_00106 [Rhynchosporium agropyri]